MAQLIDLDKKGHSSAMMQRLYGFRGSHQHCDFTVKVESEEIPAHRNVLAAGSDYFNAMLSHDTLENRSGVVEIKEADAESVKQCIDFIYTGKIHVAEGKYEQLMHVAHLFQLQQLCDEITAFLEVALDAKSFFVTKKLANMYNCTKLEEKCEQFAFKNFRSVSNDEQFLDTDKDYVLLLIRSKENVSSEDVKCNAAIAWVKHDLTRRQGYLYDILKGIDLSMVPAEYRAYLTQNESLIYENVACMKLLTKSLLVSSGITQKSFMELRECNAVIAFDKKSKCLQRFGFSKRTWTKMQKINSSMDRFSAVHAGNQLYVLMKCKAVHHLNFSDSTAVWKRVSDMIDEHGEWPPVVELGDNIYVVGGGYKTETSSVEKYDIDADQWVKLPERQISCGGSAVVAFLGCIYTFGGHQGKKELANVERFDPKTSDWCSLSPMKCARATPAVTVYNSCIYVLGGYLDSKSEFLSDVECYNPSDNVWTSITPMLLTHSIAGAFFLDSKIFIIGGFGDGGSSMESYDPVKDEWTVVTTWKGTGMELEKAFVPVISND